MPPAAAIVGGSLIGGIGGGLLQAGAARGAAETQADAANRATALQKAMFDQQRADMQPWRQAGMNALYGPGGMFRRKDGGTGIAGPTAEAKAKFIHEATLKGAQERDALLAGLPAWARPGQEQMMAMDEQIRQNAQKQWEQTGQGEPGQIGADQYEIDPEFTRNFGAADIQKDPGYEFRMAEGQKALERSAAAKGGLQSGGTLKALSQYGQDLASNEYQNAYNRFNADRDRRFNRLSSIAGMGQTADAQIGAAGQNYAANAGQNMMGAANAQAGARMASGQMWGNTLGQIAQAPGNYLMMNKLGLI